MPINRLRESRRLRLLHASATATPRLSRSISHATRKTRQRPGRYEPPEQPTVRDDGGAITLRIRKHGNRSLPLPPLMDEKVINARERLKLPKQIQDAAAPRTDMQQELEKNPYAKALATSIRMCQLTRTLHPSHFLQAFRPRFVPEQPLTSESGRAVYRAHMLPVANTKDHADWASRDSAYVLHRQDIYELLVSKKDRWSAVSNERMETQVCRQAEAMDWGDRQKNMSIFYDPDMKQRVVKLTEEEVDRRLKRIPLRFLTRVGEPDPDKGEVAFMLQRDAAVDAPLLSEVQGPDGRKVTAYNIATLYPTSDVAKDGPVTVWQYKFRAVKLQHALMRLEHFYRPASILTIKRRTRPSGKSLDLGEGKTFNPANKVKGAATSDTSEASSSA
ncbi:hypothetical protein K431DRAFT_315403 [Polychaeton citri CBS 116435]|uniref:Uncharacterized protein n=1 Tax=Polychaeton citri CBS 116435 TaxID=1314669 RepID=A0A9P4Q482_9PEZI|nr:hypothetical protein K431DRAFT_315403 [Polychaeton citri CBS 116435]